LRHGVDTSPLLIEIWDVVAGSQYTLDTQNHVAHRCQYPLVRPTTSLGTSTTPNAPPHESQFENLGTQTIEGFAAEGHRTTQLYPVGAWGFNHQVTVRTESWHSADLRTSLVTIGTSPFVEFSMRLTHISRSEPDPALFRVPSDYTIVDEKGPFTISFGSH